MHTIKKRGFIFTQVDKLAITSFITSIGAALVGTIWAIYLESFLHNASYVGFLTTLFTIVALISCVAIIPLLEKNSKSKIYATSLLLFGISYILFSILTNLYAVIILGVFAAVIATLKVTSFGIILRDKSEDKSVSQNLGLIYTFMNLSWLIGPLIAGFAAQKYGISKVFLLASVLIFISLSLFVIFKIKDKRVEKRIDRNLFKLLFNFLKDKNRFIAYCLNGGINFWWVLIYIYIPIYIVESGLGSEKVGYFLFAVIIPLVLLEYYFGKVAAKKGFKKMFVSGYAILGIGALACFFMQDLYIILLILALASFGMAMIEATTDAYFFDLITKEQRDKFYGPYNTAIDISNAIATLFGAIILLFLPFKFIFILFGTFMLIFALLSLKIKNIIEGKKN